MIRQGLVTTRYPSTYYKQHTVRMHPYVQKSAGGIMPTPYVPDTTEVVVKLKKKSPYKYDPDLALFFKKFPSLVNRSPYAPHPPMEIMGMNPPPQSSPPTQSSPPVQSQPSPISPQPQPSPLPNINWLFPGESSPGPTGERPGGSLPMPPIENSYADKYIWRDFTDELGFTHEWRQKYLPTIQFDSNGKQKPLNVRKWLKSLPKQAISDIVDNLIFSNAKPSWLTGSIENLILKLDGLEIEPVPSPPTKPPTKPPRPIPPPIQIPPSISLPKPPTTIPIVPVLPGIPGVPGIMPY